jgi:hypothetical protein
MTRPTLLAVSRLMQRHPGVDDSDVADDVDRPDFPHSFQRQHD